MGEQILSMPQSMILRFMSFIPARAMLVMAKLRIADHVDP
jgi:hypothetical protein